MKRFLLMILFIQPLLFSQSIDSLVAEIQPYRPEEQLEILTNEVWTYRSNNPIYALKCGQKGLDLAVGLRNQSKLAEINNLLGVVYRNIGQFTKALQFYNKALETAKAINDSVQIAYSYNNIGGAYRLEHNYTIALTNMFKALEIFEKLGMDDGIAFCTINIGIVYRYQENYKKAIDYFNRTKEIREKLNDNFGLALVLSQIVEVYFDQGEYDTALEKYEDLYDVYTDLDDTKGLASAIAGIGSVYFRKGGYDKAKEYRERALEINRGIENIDGILNNLNELAIIYTKLDEPELAENAIDEASRICSKPEYSSFLISNYLYRSRYFEVSGDPDSALIYYKKHTTLKDSLAARENMSSIASMEALYQVDLTAKENKILVNENKLKSEQTTFLLILAVLLISFLSFGILRYYSNKNLNQELSELNKTKDKFFSIVAHDLKNPFINLLGYSELLATDYEEMSEAERKQSVKDLHNSSKKLLALVENLLQWSSANIGSMQYNPVDVNIKDEIDELVYLYSDSIKQKNINIEKNIDPTLTLKIDQDYLKVVMRNLISNAIKFSMPDGEIKIFNEDDGKYALLKVQDFGVGIEDDKIKELFELGSQKSTRGTMNESGTGLGLILVRDLVKRCGGEITVESKVGFGSTFTVAIPKR